MKVFVLDLWEDLREKRLAPIAAALLLAIVALPVVVLKPSASDEAEDAPLPATAGVSEADRAIVALAGDAISSGGSSLDVFTPSDPFRPRGKAAQALLAAADDALGGGEVPATAKDEPAASGGDKGGGASGGGSTGGDTGGGTTGGGDTGTSKPKKPAEPVSYTYTADLRFGKSDRERLYRGVQRLDVVPRSGTPVLVFMGVSPTAKSAIFLVDSSIEQHGDGRCKPSPEECTFLYLTLERGHDLHYFTTAEGERYAVRLTDINRERTDVVAKRAAAARKAAAAKRGASRRSKGGASGDARRTPRFYPGFAADEVSVGE
ncbi:MAG TPA: hypothetical protein VNT32_08960 [Thermoleophilaceae bacterium]|nr:hypothetical protein [Thermoleophilaceae bacterium]